MISYDLKLTRWLYIEQSLGLNFPLRLKSWLFEQGSITRRCKLVCKKFKVIILKQTWSYPRPDDALLLQMPVPMYSLVREVYIVCDDNPWIYARSIIPLLTLTGKGRQLIPYLDNRPLGEFLFNHPRVLRSHLQIAQIKPSHYDYQDAMHFTEYTKEDLWGRRSVFKLYSRPLLVTEILLPALYKNLNLK